MHSRFANHCGLSPGVTQFFVVFGVCKMNALTGMKCTCAYGPASPAPLTETLNWFVSRVSLSDIYDFAPVEGGTGCFRE